MAGNLPDMVYGSRYRKSVQIQFQGLNRQLGAPDGSLWDCQNLTAEHAPVLATRRKRVRVEQLNDPGGVFCHEKLCWVDGRDFYYDGTIRGSVMPGKKTFGALGPYIVIMPDKCYFNIQTEEFGRMESAWTGLNVTFGNGLIYGEPAKANTIRVNGIQWADYFRAGDAVTIRGCTYNPGNNQTIIIREIDGDKLYFYEYSFVLSGENGTAEYTEMGPVTIMRSVPELKFLCENENRLWGCTDTEIFASKLGDIFNWAVFDGLDTDSWTLKPGSSGEFSGMASYRGYPVVFKEEHIGKVYGSFPTNFQLMESATLGVAEGSGKSLAVAGETLFYLSRSGIVAYTGGVPQIISYPLGSEKFRDAVAGSNGLNYYVCMTGENDERWLYCYDTQRGMWLKEDQQDIIDFTFFGGQLYFLNSKGELTIMTTDYSLENIPWFAEFGDFTEADPNKKGVGRLQIRLELEENAQVDILIQFDSDGKWQLVRHLEYDGSKRSWCLPIIPRRCDHYRIKLTGTGGCRIYSMTRETYSGSALRSKEGRN